MQLYLIRHAQSQNNAIWLNGGNEADERESDPRITPEGRLQAEATARHLAASFPEKPDHWHSRRSDRNNRHGYDISHLYCSLMERSVETGSIIAESLGLPLIGIHEVHEAGGIYLKEMVNGQPEIRILHGRNGPYFEENYPLFQSLRAIDPQGWWRGGREPHADRVTRAHRAIEILMERHAGTDDRVAVVTHGTFMNYLCYALLGMNMERPEGKGWSRYFVFNNCSISRLDFEDGLTQIVYLNNCGHLPDTLIS